MDIRIFDTKNTVFDENELSLTELPEIPDWVNEQLLEAGGETNGYLNVRIVSGLDPEIVEWIGDRWWMKYAWREHIVNDYYILNKPNGDKRVLSKAEGEIALKAANKGKLEGIVLPVKDRQVIEHGIPRYFVEVYRPVEYFGSPDIWEKERWVTNDENQGKLLDLMGEFPAQGLYETWFCIEEAVEDDSGKVVQTRFRPIDDIAIELIKQKIEELKPATEQHFENRLEVDKEYHEHKQEMKENVKDIVKERVNRLIK